MAAAMGAQIKIGMDAGSTISSEQYEAVITGLDINEELLDAAGLRGSRSHASERVRQGTRAPRFSLTLQPNSVELDALLPRILGGAEAADAFPLAETLPSFVANLDLVQKRWHFTGCKVARARFYSAAGGPLNLDLEVEALEVAVSDTAFPSLSINTVGPYLHSDVVLSVGGSAYNFREVSLAIDNQLDTGRFFNSQTRISLPEQDRVVTWTFDGPFGDNSALYGLAVAGVAALATWTNGNRSLQCSSTKTQFPRRPPAVNGREEIMLPLEGVARKDGSTNELTCTNDSTG